MDKWSQTGQDRCGQKSAWEYSSGVLPSNVIRHQWVQPLRADGLPDLGVPRCDAPPLTPGSRNATCRRHLIYLSNHPRHPALLEFPSRAAPREDCIPVSATDTEFFPGRK